MKKIYINLIFLNFVLVFILISCRNKESGWNTDLLTPIATADLSISNLVSDSFITTNTDNSLNLVYKKNIYAFDFSKSLRNLP
jgi:hypothetical protein